MEEVSFNHKGKRVKTKVKNCGLFGKAFGLMFKPRGMAKALLFKFEKPTTMGIHSLFVFFPFIAVWLDDKGKVVGMKKVKPFTLSVYPTRKFSKLIEVPFNEKYQKEIKLLSKA